MKGEFQACALATSATHLVDGVLHIRPGLQSYLRLTESSAPELPTMGRKVQSADDHSRHREHGCRHIRIDQAVEVMEQKPALVWFDSRLRFKPILQHSQRTGPRKQFRKNAPD